MPVEACRGDDAFLVAAELCFLAACSPQSLFVAHEMAADALAGLRGRAA